jgi:hypothetical protein
LRPSTFPPWTKQISCDNTNERGRPIIWLHGILIKNFFWPGWNGISATRALSGSSAKWNRLQPKTKLQNTSFNPKSQRSSFL